MKLGNILIFGDSYSTYEGRIPEGYAVYYSGHRTNPPDVSAPELTWWGRILKATESALIQNNSWSGSTIGYTGYNNSDCSHSSSFIYRFEKLLADGFFEKNRIDTVFVFGGTNDSWSNAPLGEFCIGGIEDTELFNVLPAISHFAKRLSEELPEARTVFLGNCDIKTEVTDALRDACAHYGHIYVALKSIDKLNGHPTELGMEQIAEQVLAALS